MATCFCCPKPRYKRLVDGLFPEDPQTPTPVSANIDKLLFFVQTSPDHLDNIGEYLALRLRQSLQKREKRVRRLFQRHTCTVYNVDMSCIAREIYRPSPYLRNRKWCTVYLLIYRTAKNNYFGNCPGIIGTDFYRACEVSGIIRTSKQLHAS